jgi:hypothetical protein
MVAKELYQQFFALPLLRLTVFFVFLTVLVELLTKYVYSWIKSDIEQEILNISRTSAAREQSIAQTAKENCVLELQRKKIEQLTHNLMVWEKNLKQKNTALQLQLEENLVIIKQKQRLSVKHTNQLKRQQRLARTCLENLRTQVAVHQDADNSLFTVAMEELRKLS